MQFNKLKIKLYRRDINKKLSYLKIKKTYKIASG